VGHPQRAVQPQGELEVTEMVGGKLRLVPARVARDAMRWGEPGVVDQNVQRPIGADEARREGVDGRRSVSRTTFAERFRTVAGMPPLTYLNQWRMLLARRALRDRGLPITALATELGYASDSAFSTAFKRVVGESPLRYRRRVTPED
jgi:AraC-like DNA-binding protein